MNKIKGFSKVFSFTFQQALKRKGFKFVTAFVSIMIILACVLGNMIFAVVQNDKKSGKKKDEKSEIEMVYVLDESGLLSPDYTELMKGMDATEFDEIVYETVEGKTMEEVAVMAGSYSAKSVAVHITRGETGFVMEGVIPDTSDIKEENLSSLMSVMKDCFDQNKLMQAGLTMKQLTVAMTPVQAMYISVGEDTSIAVMLIKMIAPMLFSLLLYLMLLLYGKDICKEVSTEKTTKLMETLLIDVHPYALLSGKILAISLLAIIQVLIWVVSLVVSFLIGNSIAQIMYPDTQNQIVVILDFFRTNLGESALSIPSFLIAMVFFCVGFVFYCVLAGLAGSMVSKPEDAAMVHVVFQYPIVISFIISYLLPLSDNNTLIMAARFIPFISPFTMPVDLLTGVESLPMGLLSLLVLVVFSALVIYLSARIYKGMVLYHGQKLSLKKLVNIIKN